MRLKKQLIATRSGGAIRLINVEMSSLQAPAVPIFHPHHLGQQQNGSYDAVPHFTLFLRFPTAEHIWEKIPPNILTEFEMYGVTRESVDLLLVSQTMPWGKDTPIHLHTNLWMSNNIMSLNVKAALLDATNPKICLVDNNHKSVQKGTLVTRAMKLSSETDQKNAHEIFQLESDAAAYVISVIMNGNRGVITVHLLLDNAQQERLNTLIHELPDNLSFDTFCKKMKQTTDFKDNNGKPFFQSLQQWLPNPIDVQEPITITANPTPPAAAPAFVISLDHPYYNATAAAATSAEEKDKKEREAKLKTEEQQHSAQALLDQGRVIINGKAVLMQTEKPTRSLVVTDESFKSMMHNLPSTTNQTNENSHLQASLDSQGRIVIRKTEEPTGQSIVVTDESRKIEMDRLPLTTNQINGSTTTNNSAALAAAEREAREEAAAIAAVAAFQEAEIKSQAEKPEEDALTGLNLGGAEGAPIPVPPPLTLATVAEADEALAEAVAQLHANTGLAGQGAQIETQVDRNPGAYYFSQPTTTHEQKADIEARHLAKQQHRNSPTHAQEDDQPEEQGEWVDDVHERYMSRLQKEEARLKKEEARLKAQIAQLEAAQQNNQTQAPQEAPVAMQTDHNSAGYHPQWELERAVAAIEAACAAAQLRNSQTHTETYSDKAKPTT